MEPVPTSSQAAPAERLCQNCGARLLGEHCYACGQPVKGLVRHFSSIVGDFFDSVFDFDSRTFRTLGPLLLRPGYLSEEYFHGRRVRYVSPLRLFFFLCITAIFTLHLTMDIDLEGGGDATAISAAETVADVERLREETISELNRARESIPDAPGARVGMDVAIRAVEDEAAKRLAWLRERDAALARGEEPPPYRPRGGAFTIDASDSEGPDPGAERTVGIQLDGKPWHPVDNPIHVAWLPELGNAWLNRIAGRAQDNVARIQKQPRLLIEAFMEALPQTLFVLLPVFALLLKIIYLFKRRLYMEHLIVALHSHAFLCASILLLVGLGALRDAAVGVAFVHAALGWAEAAVAIWMPLYLLLMQKRVYRQGWIMTVVKYGVLGTCYLVLLSIGASINLAVSLVAM